jgi:hypothetical protein
MRVRIRAYSIHTLSVTQRQKKITTPVYTATTLYKKFHSILSLPVFAAAEGFFGTAKLLPPPPLRTAGTLEERDDLAELEDLA